MREMMEDVVLEGTGKPAQLDGYTAAGKSGTAQKIDPATGRYSATQYNSSFVGFAPVNNPVISILVVLDSPVGPHHGGEVGGPVFKRVAEQVLAYRDEAHDVPAPSDIETAKNLQVAPRRASGPDGATEAAQARFQAAVAKTKHAERGTADGRVWRFDCSCGPKPRGPDGSRRDGGVFAIGTGAVADRQRSCT